MEKMLFTKELSIYLKSAVPLHEALLTLRHHEKLPSFQKIVDHISGAIENGQTLAHALGHFPRVFDRLYVSLVEIGEVSGTLPMSLEYLTIFLERSYALRKKVQGIFLYPSIVISVAVIISTFITLYILPQLVRLFTSFHTTLPFSTRLLLGFSNFIQQHGWVVLASVIVVILCIRLLFLIPVVKKYWQLFLPHLPFLGGFLREYYIASFFHDVGILLKSGIPVTEAFAVEQQSHRNEAFRSVAGRLVQALGGGKSIWETLELDSVKLFPPIVIKMVAVGERSGKLEETFLYLSSFFDEEVERSIKNFTVLLEPILLVIIGGIVAFIATAILAPIYTLTGSIRR